MLTAAVETFGAELPGAAADAAAPAPISALAALPPPPPPPLQAAVNAIAPPTRPTAITLRIDLTSIPPLLPAAPTDPTP
ncbi:hypothetical protein GCM10010502_33230 [Kitasatospora aureofaciens]|uniref:Uncharacterized protein n=1 Tax=Kitasatospora aureofaciens TaxID=1894 RepID=A0A8H9LNN1_KITAU|nr:hypothetical protein GCM10010502_33230 [Kitasatospora aureofaciens]